MKEERRIKAVEDFKAVKATARTINQEAVLSGLTTRQILVRKYVLGIVEEYIPQTPLSLHALQELKYRLLFLAEDKEQDLLTKIVLDTLPTHFSEMREWAMEPDSITNALYPPVIDGADINAELIKFPFAKNVKKTDHSPIIGHLGDQTSRHHLETISEHIDLTTASMKQALPDEITDTFTFAIFINYLAYLHDCGKKYVTTTNKIGELCFYGHAELSAYIAGLFLMCTNYYPISELKAEDERVWVMILAIYGHMLPKDPNAARLLSNYRQLVHEFFTGTTEAKDVEKYTAMVMKYIDLLAKCDDGIPDTQENRKMLQR